MSNDTHSAGTELQVTQSELDEYNASLPEHLKAELWEMEKVEVIRGSYPMAKRSPKIVIRDVNYLTKYANAPTTPPMTSKE